MNLNKNQLQVAVLYFCRISFFKTLRVHQMDLEYIQYFNYINALINFFLNKELCCYTEHLIQVTDQTSATTNRNEKAKRVISVSGEIPCVFNLRSKCFYSNLLYSRNLQRPDATCHFPRALVENQAALL